LYIVNIIISLYLMHVFTSLDITIEKQEYGLYDLLIRVGIHDTIDR
jgi:hypothetical protein